MLVEENRSNGSRILSIVSVFLKDNALLHRTVAVCKFAILLQHPLDLPDFLSYDSKFTEIN